MAESLLACGFAIRSQIIWAKERLAVVGDDAQAIYSFRAAEVRNILDFPGQFVPRARTITLERNYRSSEPILLAANAVISEAREQFAKTLWTERRSDARPLLTTVFDETAQADYVCAEVLAARETGVPLKSQAVLFRTHSAQLEIELTRRNIPFVKFGGLKFLEASHVKDLLALLRYAENPRDRLAGFRVLQLLPGVGPSTAEDILTKLEAGSSIEAASANARVRSSEHWASFVQVFDLLRRGAAGCPAEIEAARAWYEPHLERLHDDAAVRAGDLTQLVRMAAGFASRASFLTDITLDPPQSTGDLAGAPSRDEDYLILSTIHSAKGQEWRSVFVLNCVDGCIPSDLATGTPAEIEEERRLFYVAMTRAKDALHLITPMRFYTHGQHARGDKHMYAARTRFLPEHILDKFERRAWALNGDQALSAVRPLPPRDLKARMRSMWA